MKKANTIQNILGAVLILTILLSYPISAAIAQTPQPDTPQADSKTYIPLVAKPLKLSTDLTVSAIEVTQAVQGANNHVYLVDGRQTTVRVYARVNEANPLGNVRVALSATRNGAPLPGSPLVSAAMSAYPLSISANTLRLDIQKSFNFQLPPEWLGGQVNLEAHVDSGNSYWESNETNNTMTYTANFLAIPALTVKIVPINYTSTYEQKTYSLSPTALEQNRQKIRQAIMKIYPVSSANIVMRSSALNFTGDLYNISDWDTLLNRIAALKSTDGSPASEVYYGLIPVVDSSGNSWWYGGYLGLGYVGPPLYPGPRAAIGLASAYIKTYNYTVEGEVTAAHEIGHNLGRLHAPCGGPSGVDPAYPYSGGIIGQLGLDTSNLQLYPPTTNFDIMGYCDNVWISDYNYVAMMQSQISFGSYAVSNPQAQDSLLLSAQIDAQGALHVQPSYVLPIYPTDEISASDFLAEFLDESGEVLASHPIPVSYAQAKEFSSYLINAVLPLPDRKPDRLRILRNGETIFEQAFIQPGRKLAPNLDEAKMTVQASAETLALNWNLAGIPALLRYSEDGGMTWTTLEIENTSGNWSGSSAMFSKSQIQFQLIPAWSLEAITINWSTSQTE